MTNKRRRGFEVIEAYKDQDIQLPHRSTFHAAGYDLEAATTMTLPAYWKQAFIRVAKSLGQWIHGQGEEQPVEETDIFPSTLVPTGLKAYMEKDEYLQVVNRSSNPMKRRLMLPNGIGIIDQDYYNNAKNEGHIYVQLINYGLRDYTIHKGDRIAQGIFHKYLLTDDDSGGLSERTGGFGSSDPVTKKED